MQLLLPPPPKPADPIVIEPAMMDNAVLKRLIEEVRGEMPDRVHAYNRSHNRHNRSM